MPTVYSGNDAFPASANIPSGGDARSAASVNVPIEALFDRTIWLLNRSNDFFYYENDTNSSGDPVSVETFAYNSIGTTWTKSASIFVDVAGCEESDVLVARLKLGGVNISGGTGTPLASVRIYTVQDTGGAMAQVPMPFSHAIVEHNSAGVADEIWPVHLDGKVIISAAGVCRVGLEVRLRLASAGFELTAYSGILLEVQRVKA